LFRSLLIACLFRLSVKNLLEFSKSSSDTTISKISFHHSIFVKVFAKICILFSLSSHGIVKTSPKLLVFHLSHINLQYLSSVFAIMSIFFVQAISSQFLFFLEPGIFI
jgi:hypothetical protein